MNDYLTRKDLALRWKVSISTINKYAAVKPHLLPKGIKVCGTYRYALNEVIKFERELGGLNDPF